MNFKDIPVSRNLQALALDEKLPDGLYLTRIMNTVRKVLVIDGIVSLYGSKHDFVNRFGQHHFL